MHIRLVAAGVGLLACAAAGCSRTVRVESGGDVVGNTPASARALPAGTTMEVELDRSISATESRAGDRFTAHVTNSVVAQNGATAVPAGSRVYGIVTAVDPSTSSNRPALIRLDFQTLRVDGNDYPFDANVEQTTVPGLENPDVLKKAGIGAAAGAVLGAVLGGGDLKDIVLGGAIGAAAGSVISLGTNSANATLPAGTRMTLRTTRRVSLRY